MHSMFNRNVTFKLSRDMTLIAYYDIVGRKLWLVIEFRYYTTIEKYEKA